MTKLIGTNPNQVPSNADLGTAAFIDKKEVLLSKGSNLSAIDRVIQKTAIDVLVYDTSADSDGGAWRKKTSNTSWYNEDLYTITRGKRKEFPAVAVLVVETLKVTIYDGDDPDLSMWMVIEADQNTLSTSGKTDDRLVVNTFAMFHTSGLNTIGAINGRIYVGSTNWHLFQFDFPNDRISSWFQYSTVGAGYFYYTNDISGRNTTGTYYRQTDWGIKANSIEDISVIVLPDAKIDDATNLPIPTVAIATGAGSCIIRDNLSVIDITGQLGGAETLHYWINFDPDGNLFVGDRGQSGNGAFYPAGFIAKDLPSLDEDIDNFSIAYGSTASNALGAYPKTRGRHYGMSGFAVCGPNGMTQLYHNYADIENSMVAYTASDYSSGWMNGRTRLATLSDTTPGSLQYDNLLTNGTFDSDTSGWTAGTGATLSSSSGQLVITQSSGSNGRAQSNSFATELDKHYMFTVDGISTTASNFRMEVRGPELVDTTFTAGQEGVIFFRGTGSNMYVELYNIGGTGTATTYDNAFVTQVVDNRTYFNRNDLGTPTTAGVKLFGRLERRPVAPGADLVSYSGFSSAAYLRQPYDDNLDFGNGQDFCFNMWFRTPDPSEFGVLLHRSATVNGAGTWAGSGPIVQVEFNTSHLRNGIYGNAFGTQANIDVPYTQYKENTWHMHTFLRRGDTTEVYKDGVLMDKLNNANSSQTLSGSRASLWIGNRPDYGNRPFNGDIALFRVTSEAPTPHQIKKMYNDEKYLFKKDAKCTLYGTSDTVSAIAYDPITKVTHAGTSQGRSSFQGLTRIDNTADGVGYFLSAHDGFVVEG